MAAIEEGKKSTSWLCSSENSEKRMNHQNCMFRIKEGRSDDAKQRKKRGWPKHVDVLHLLALTLFLRSMRCLGLRTMCLFLVVACSLRSRPKCY